MRLRLVGRFLQERQLARPESAPSKYRQGEISEKCVCVRRRAALCGSGGRCKKAELSNNAKSPCYCPACAGTNNRQAGFAEKDFVSVRVSGGDVRAGAWEAGRVLNYLQKRVLNSARAREPGTVKWKSDGRKRT
jgi:hypothetical protein